MSPSLKFDGYKISMPVNRPFWVQAWVVNGGGGDARLMVYRSTWLENDNHRWLSPIRSLLRRSEVVEREVITDPGMVFGEAERTIYRLTKE